MLESEAPWQQCDFIIGSRRSKFSLLVGAFVLKRFGLFEKFVVL